MKHAFYRLEKTKIAFKQHWLINSKLYQPIFNYPKFYAINFFVQYIWNNISMINYNSAYSKAAYKYFFKTFYKRRNNKEYKLQIWQDNIQHTNIIAIKNVIILKKAKEKQKLLESPINYKYTSKSGLCINRTLLILFKDINR